MILQILFLSVIFFVSANSDKMVTTSTVDASPSCQPEIFYRQTVFRIARNWARVPSAPWEKVRDPLFIQCPHARDYDSLVEGVSDLVLS